MKLVYTHSNRFLVLNAKNLVELENITVILRNEFSSAAAGELPPIDNWLELWVAEDLHFDRALRVISAFNAEPSADWWCKRCGEQNGCAFEHCWECSAFRD